MTTYANIPSAAQFKNDSSVLAAVRAKDHNLAAIDGLLEAFPRATARDERFTALVELFFAINSWVMALRAKVSGVEPKRYDAIMALLAVVEKELMAMLGIANRGTLASELVKICGLKLTSGGLSTDLRFNAQYFKSARREAAKLHILGGVIKRYTVDLVGAPKGLQPVESSWFVNANMSRGAAGFALPDFAPFVMSMEREFFMTYHFHGSQGVYHSAYFAGGPVAMAGTMLIRNGRLLGIRGDSGHYQPGPEKMAACLRALKAKGVVLRGVQVYDYAAYALHQLAEHVIDGPTSLGGYQAPQRVPTQVGAPPGPPATVQRSHRPLPPIPVRAPQNTGAPPTYANNPNYNNFPNAGRPLPPIPVRGQGQGATPYANNPNGGRPPSPNAGRPLPPIPVRGQGAVPYANNPNATVDAEDFLNYN